MGNKVHTLVQHYHTPSAGQTQIEGRKSLVCEGGMLYAEWTSAVTWLVFESSVYQWPYTACLVRKAGTRQP